MVNGKSLAVYARLLEFLKKVLRITGRFLLSAAEARQP